MSQLPPDDFLEMISWLGRQKAEQERRNRNRRREGRIIEANPEKGLYRVRLREENGSQKAFDSPWLQVKALASGALKIQAEPTVGQWVEVVSESGDLTDGVIEMSAYTEDNARPHNRAGELAVTVGGYRGVIDKDGAETTAAKARTHKTEGDVAHDVGGDVTFRTGGVVRFT
ncbi:phage baseplate assembly protein V [Xanthobacter sp. TB0136]|uniref:phage baseplate assembly protein V n=1 Tax=Xanthobacter sp. TB0136 TaxID=3459177 RepID=UPI00403A09F0